jgi:hypothetical protein
MLCVAAPRAAQAQTTPTDTLVAAPVVRPLEAVVVTARRPSAFSRFGLRAGITAKQRENRRLARQLAAYDRLAFGLERKLDSLMIVATIHELNIARTDSATAMLRNRRLHLETMLCQAAPAECRTTNAIASGMKGD